MPLERWVRRALLFGLAVWPTWVVSLPPFQDLPNHLATAYVQSHLDQYPDLVSNGFLKTNASLFLFLHVAMRFVSLRTAAKLFVTLVALVGAVGYPVAANRFGKNERSATYVLWAMVHNWFIAMGMLDYALSVPLALLVLVALDRFRREGDAKAGALAAALSLLVWYTHAFAVVLLLLLVGVELAWTAWRDRAAFRTTLVRLSVPLVPVVALTAWSVLVQLSSEAPVRAETIYQSPPEVLYEAWSEWLWSLTKWTLVSLPVAFVLAWYGVRRFKQSVPFFSPLAMGVLAAGFVMLPYHAHHWFHISSRLLPFLWMGCVLRFPEELPAWLSRSLAVCAAAFSAGLGVEYVLCARDADAVVRGEQAVPEGSRLLPMIFDRKGPHGDNTYALLHVWGLYVVDRGTTAPLLFAHSKSFPVSYATPPPERFHGMNLEWFPYTMRSREAVCADLRREGVIDGCETIYGDVWKDFWRDATPRFDRVLMVGAGPDVRAVIPSTFHVLFDEGETLVLSTR